MFPTSCPDCGSAVYFLSCTCGSKVFFDTAGTPWIHHYDTCKPGLARQLLNEGYSGRELRQLVEQRALQEGTELDDETLWLLAQLDTSSPLPLVLEHVSPRGEAEALGQVTELTKNVNFFKRFGLAKSQVAEALLGELLAEEHCRVVLRTEPELPTMITQQYEFYAPARMIREQDVKRGDYLLVRLSEWRLLEEAIWLGRYLSKGESE